MVIGASTSMRASGVTGRLLCGGRQAAALGRWQLEPSEGGHRVTAVPLLVDRYWLAHGGRFTLLLGLGSRTWRWDRAQVLDYSDREIVIRAEGRPEE